MSDNMMSRSLNINDVFSSMKAGFISLKQRFVLHLITCLLLVFLFAIMLSCTLLFVYSYVLFIIAMIFSSFSLPMIFAALTITDQITGDQLRKINYFKYISGKIWESNTLQLMLIYVLILVALTLSLSLLTPLLGSEQQVTLLSVTFKVLWVILQFVSFIAIPANILLNGRYKPFHMLWYSFKAMLRNFIPSLAFMLLNIIIVIGVLSAIKYLALSINASLVYLNILIVLLLIMWFGLSCVYFARRLIER